MTETEADEFIAAYRALLKNWTMCVAGIRDGDPEPMQLKLDADQHILNEIASLYPAKAYSVDLLVNARKRTWAGYEHERVPRVRRA